MRRKETLLMLASPWGGGKISRPWAHSGCTWGVGRPILVTSMWYNNRNDGWQGKYPTPLVGGITSGAADYYDV